jgi:hypothetical protein
MLCNRRRRFLIQTVILCASICFVNGQGNPPCYFCNGDIAGTMSNPDYLVDLSALGGLVPVETASCSQINQALLMGMVTPDQCELSQSTPQAVEIQIACGCSSVATSEPLVFSPTVATQRPTRTTTSKPTRAPKVKPTRKPAKKPKRASTKKPTRSPTGIPTETPSSQIQSIVVSDGPSVVPSDRPSDAVSQSPTGHLMDTAVFTSRPTVAATTTTPSFSTAPTGSTSACSYRLPIPFFATFCHFFKYLGGF